MSSTENKLDNTDKNINKLLQTGFDTISQAFQLKGNSYEFQLSEKNKKINNLKNKINLLKQEIEMIKNENIYFKSQIEQFKKNNNISFSVMTPKNLDKKTQSSIQIFPNETTNKSINDSIVIQNNNNNINNENNNIYNNLLSFKTNNIKKPNSIQNTELNITEQNNFDIVYEKSGHYKKRKNNSNRTLYKNLNSYSSSNLNNNNKEESKTRKRRNNSLCDIPLSDNKNYTIKYLNENLKDNKNYQSHNPINNNNNYFSQKINNNNNRNINQNFIYEQINNNSDDSSSTINSKQQEQMTNFLNECKIKLPQKVFDFIVKTFQDFKDGIIDEESVMFQIKNILQKYPELKSLFESIFLI